MHLGDVQESAQQRLRSGIDKQFRFRVLGPVEAVDGDENVALGGAKTRLLLAALLVELGRVLATERLIDILWGEHPPETSRALVHTYISALRRALNRPGAEEVIVTRPPGYLARIAHDDLDSAVFERLVATARAAAGDGQDEEAARRFRAADALWRGPAYGGVESSIIVAEAARLDALRLAATEECIDVELRLGREQDLVSELTALVARHPTHERLRSRLMVALYRLGRQADALATYREGREALADQLGIDPGPELQRTHEAILRGDPELFPAARTTSAVDTLPHIDAPAPAANPGAADPTVRPVTPGDREAAGAGARGAMNTERPAQLPRVPPDFTGRTAQVAELVSRLAPTSDDCATAASPICVIVGRSGMGKSTLALRVGHEVAAEFPDGQLYADLRGSTETPAQPGEVLGRFLRALGTDPASLPESTDERAERLRTVLAARRVFMVLDDAASEQQVRPMLPGGAGNAILITGRRRLSGLAGAAHVELDVLRDDEAVTLLGRIAGEHRVAGERLAAQALVRLCGCLPLAVRIVGARLSSRPHWTFGGMVTRLADEARRLDELSVADQQVRAGIELTYRGLDERARATLRALSWLGLPDFPAWITASLLDVSTVDGEALVDELVDAQLLDVAGTDAVDQPRYRIHELVGVYARERAAAEDPPERRAAAVRRLMGTWLWLIGKINNRAPTGAIPLHPPRPQPYAADALVADSVLAHPSAWLEAEQECLVTAVERAAALDLVDVSVALATALCGSAFAIGNQFEAWGRTHTAALTAARRAGDRAAEAVLLTQLGQLRCEQDNYVESHEYLLEALTIFRELGDRAGEATVQAALGSTCREQGRLSEAMHFLRQAFGYFQTTSIDPAIGYTGRLIGATRLEQGDFAEARADLTQAAAAYRRSACRRGEALAIRSLSMVHRAMAQLDDSLALSLEALVIFRELGDDLLEAYGAQSVAKTLIRLGRGQEALAMLQCALATCARLGDRWGEAFMLRTRGELHLAAGHLAQAEADLTESARRWTALDVPVMRARTERDLAALRDAQGDRAAAADVRAAAMETFRTYGAREYSELALDTATPTGHL